MDCANLEIPPLRSFVILADQFIVLNDDYFIGKETHPSDFFTINRGPRLFVEFLHRGKGIRDMRRQDLWGRSNRRSFAAVNEVYTLVKDTELDV